MVGVDTQGWGVSPRGAGCLFGCDVAGRVVMCCVVVGIDTQGWGVSPRGAGCLFGSDVVGRVVMCCGGCRHTGLGRQSAGRWLPVWLRRRWPCGDVLWWV